MRIHTMPLPAFWPVAPKYQNPWQQLLRLFCEPGQRLEIADNGSDSFGVKKWELGCSAASVLVFMCRFSCLDRREELLLHPPVRFHRSDLNYGARTAKHGPEI